MTVTLTVPAMPKGLLTTILVAVSLMIIPPSEPKRTALAPSRFVPAIVTVVPPIIGPAAGLTPVTAGPLACCVTAICWPSSVMWAVRRVGPVFAVNEKLTTPPETLPMVSQLALLRGARYPSVTRRQAVRAASASLPAAAPSLIGPSDTYARGVSIIWLVPELAT